MSDTLSLRVAQPQDFTGVLAMLKTFYEEDHIPYVAKQVEPGLQQILQDARNGAVLILQSDALPCVGYIILGWCFSVEQGGRYVLLDELYLAPAARGRGWGKQALALARDWAQAQGAAVMRLEVNHHNARAKALYLASGYRDDERDILTLPLAATQAGLHS